MATIEIKIPDIGDFSDVEVIEIMVNEGDEIAVEDPLVTLETDKAAMDVPATQAGKVVSVAISVGDKASEGDTVLTVETAEDVESAADAPAGEKPAAAETDGAPAPAPKSAPQPEGDATHRTELVVIGSGPGGYTAAFRAADLGMKVILIERYESLGGVCLNVGCIPSKALLHAAKVVDEAREMAEHGIQFGEPEIDASKLNGWKGDVVGRLTGGIEKLAKARKVQVIHASALFESTNRLILNNGVTVDFDKCIIAAGSQSAKLPGLPDDPRIVDSTGSLQIDPLLVVGGGIIGLEMACVYSALGVKVSVVELMNQLMPGTDPDLVRPFVKVVKPRYESIMLETKVSSMEAKDGGIEVTFDGKNAPKPQLYDRVLVAISRCRQTCRTSLPSATSPAGRCWRTRQRTKQRLLQKWPRARRLRLTPGRSPPWPTPIRKLRGWVFRKRRRRSRV